MGLGIGMGMGIGMGIGIAISAVVRIGSFYAAPVRKLPRLKPTTRPRPSDARPCYRMRPRALDARW